MIFIGNTENKYMNEEAIITKKMKRRKTELQQKNKVFGRSG